MLQHADLLAFPGSNGLLRGDGWTGQSAARDQGTSKPYTYRYLAHRSVGSSTLAISRSAGRHFHKALGTHP